MVLTRLDELGRGTWIALVVLGFWFWWPIGLAVLAYLAFARQRHGGGPGLWYNAPNGTDARPQSGPWSGPWGRAGGGCWPGARRGAPQSGNHAFDDYRAETLRRLEDEQREFVEYLERLRQARDKSEFDAFMAERRTRQAPPAPPAGNG